MDKYTTLALLIIAVITASFFIIHSIISYLRLKNDKSYLLDMVSRALASDEEVVEKILGLYKELSTEIYSNVEDDFEAVRTNEFYDKAIDLLFIECVRKKLLVGKYLSLVNDEMVFNILQYIGRFTPVFRNEYLRLIDEKDITEDDSEEEIPEDEEIETVELGYDPEDTVDPDIEDNYDENEDIETVEKGYDPEDGIIPEE